MRNHERMVHEALERWVADLCARGLAHMGRVLRDDYGSRWRVEFGVGGPSRYHEITDHEIAMHGGDALHQWMRVAERDLARIQARRRAADRAVNPPLILSDINPYQGGVTWLGIDRAAGNDRAAMTATEASERHGQGITRWYELARQFDHALADGWAVKWDSPDPEADKRARDLFRAVAGQPAYDTLSSGKPLPITGSKGTKYTLHNRATYCVERSSDGAKLCAVVPNVPLWDHLLGIKLMVEHDEPKFLETANVSGGIMPGGFTYVDEASDFNRQHLDFLRYGVSIRHGNSVIRHDVT